MGHDINIAFGRPSFFSAREKAWHGLGTVTKEALTTEEAIKTAHLDFEVKRSRLYADLISVEKSDKMSSQTPMKRVDKRFAIYRDDTKDILGIVGSKYKIFQNTEAFAFFDGVVQAKEAIIETAGALGLGERIFITAKLPGYIRVPYERIEKYLLLFNSHDGTGSIMAMFTPIRVVCNNTLHAAISKGSNIIRVRHTEKARDRLEEGIKMVGVANKLSEELAEIFTYLKRESVVDKDAIKFFKKLLFTKEEIEEKIEVSTRKQNIFNDMWTFYMSGIGQKYITGTEFGLYNSVSGYYQNVKTSTNPKRIIESIMVGSAAQKVKESLNILINKSYVEI